MSGVQVIVEIGTTPGFLADATRRTLLHMYAGDSRSQHADGVIAGVTHFGTKSLRDR